MLCDLLVVLFVAAVWTKISNELEETIEIGEIVSPPQRKPVASATWSYKDRLGNVHTEVCS